MPPSFGRRSTTRVASAVAAAMLVLISDASVATAHAELVSATPAPSASLETSPDAVVLVFSEAVGRDTARVVVSGPGGEAVGSGDAEVSPDGLVVAAVLPELEPATYVVAYEVVSAVDGHVVTGRYAFLVDPTQSAAPPVGTATSTSPSVGPASIAARWIALLGLLIAFGTAVAALLTIPRAGGPRASVTIPWRLLASSGALGAIGVAAYLWLSAGPIPTGNALVRVLDPAAPYGWSGFAVAMRIGLAAAIAVALLAVLRRRRAAGPTALALTIVAGIGLAGMSGAGHAASLGGVAFGALDWAHLLAVGAWLGAIPALIAIGRRGDGPSVATMLRAHAPVAIVGGPIVALTGLGSSPIVLGTSRDVVGSMSGNLLLAKVGLLAVAMALGLVNHLALRGRGRAAVGLILGAELVVAAVAVGVAAGLVTLQPAAARDPATGGAPSTAAHLFGETDQSGVHLTLTPAAPGEQGLQVTLRDLDRGGPREGLAAVTASFAPAGAAADATTVRLDPDTTYPGLWTAHGSFTPTVGEWSVSISMSSGGGETERLSFTFPVVHLPEPEPIPAPDTGIGVPAPMALLWPLLPPGPLAWLPAVAGVALLFAVGRRMPMGGARTIARVTIGVLVVALGLAAGTRSAVDAANAPTAPLPTRPPLDAGAADRGEALYLANCASCHGRDGKGDGPIRTLPAAGSLAETVRDASDAELSYRIANGVVGTAMPAFAGRLTEQERWDLVAYLRARFGSPP